VAAELLNELGIVAHDAVAAFDMGLARGNPRRRLLMRSKGRLDLVVAHDGTSLGETSGRYMLSAGRAIAFLVHRGTATSARSADTGRGPCLGDFATGAEHDEQEDGDHR
jgi:hypothetical protein